MITPRRSLPLLAKTLLLLTILLFLSASAALATSEGSDGGDGGNESSGVGGPYNIWEIDPGLPNEPAVDENGTLQLETPLEQNLRKVWEGLGGEDGTGETLEEWLSSARAGKAAVQELLEEEMEEAHAEADSSNRAYVVVETLDEAGKVTQVVLSFCPPVGVATSVGLDAGRAFADAYNKALDEGKSTEEAIKVGLKHATAKGTVTAFTAGTIGNSAGNMWDKMKKIPTKRVVDVAKKGSNFLGSMGAKTVEFATNAGADEIRSKTMDHSAPSQAENHAPQPAPVPAKSFFTRGGHQVFE